ncbi:MAG: hypothetical protein OHK0013_13370 [Sandaracinaceae bacterium]
MAFSDKYTLEVPLGESEIGTVWAAETKDGQRVVIAMAEEDAPEDVKERVEQHGRALAEVSHPNIVRVLEAGVNEDGVPYLVMERLEGTSLAKRWTAEPPLRADRMMEIGIGVVEGLVRAHEVKLPDGSKLVHGDVEPGNVLLVGAPGKEIPKLIGWGLNRALAREAATASRASLGSLGPVAYGAPEQARGEVITSISADLYSAAALIFAGLTGRPPHVAPDAAAIAEAIARRTPPSLSSLRKDLAPFAATLDRALSSDPKKRFSEGSALVRALRTSLAMGRVVGNKELPVGERSAVGPADVEAAPPAPRARSSARNPSRSSGRLAWPPYPAP